MVINDKILDEVYSVTQYIVGARSSVFGLNQYDLTMEQGLQSKSELYLRFECLAQSTVETKCIYVICPRRLSMDLLFHRI